VKSLKEIKEKKISEEEVLYNANFSVNYSQILDITEIVRSMVYHSILLIDFDQLINKNGIFNPCLNSKSSTEIYIRYLSIHSCLKQVYILRIITKQNFETKLKN